MGKSLFVNFFRAEIWQGDRSRQEHGRIRPKKIFAVARMPSRNLKNLALYLLNFRTGAQHIK